MADVDMKGYEGSGQKGTRGRLFKGLVAVTAAANLVAGVQAARFTGSDDFTLRETRGEQQNFAVHGAARAAFGAFYAPQVLGSAVDNMVTRAGGSNALGTTAALTSLVATFPGTFIGGIVGGSARAMTDSADRAKPGLEQKVQTRVVAPKASL